MCIRDRRLGYKVDPGPFDKRYDIVQEILLQTPQNLATFAKKVSTVSYTHLDVYKRQEYEKTLGSMDVKVDWLTDWPTIVDVAEAKGVFSPDTAFVIREFLADPHKWSRARGGK